MYTESEQKQYYESVKPYMDENGWFPDDILDDSFWVLSLCNKRMIGDKLYWKFVKPIEDVQEADVS